MRLYNQDNREALKELPDNSVDSVVTDPPYGLSFMNKKWDYDVPSVEFWKEVYRVLKPGGHILSFGGTRTYHRMVVNIEDAGFEIRDQIQWIYGSGFPKSLNIGKSVDKIEGNEREVVGDNPNNRPTSMRGVDTNIPSGWKIYECDKITKGQSEYEGFGTALKPANEPIVLARKPLSEKSIAENVMRWRTGGLNIDGCRIGFQGDKPNQIDCKRNKENQTGWAASGLADRPDPYIPNDTGRFPANVILECICDEVIQGEKGEIVINTRKAGNSYNDYEGEKNENIVTRIESYGDKGDIHTNPDCPCYILDKNSGYLKSGEVKSHHKHNKQAHSFYTEKNTTNEYKRNKNTSLFGYGDGGGASRFFYRAKVSKKERNLGLDGFDENEVVRQGLAGEKNNPIHKNNHPTVKPINLLTYLCRLITPERGIILDPFMGSGSTGVAALLEGFDFIGIELEKDYYNIAKRRIEKYEEYKKIIK